MKQRRFIETKADRIRRLLAANPMISLPKETLLDLRIEPHQALEKLRMGLAEANDLETLGSRINLGRIGADRFKDNTSYPDAVNVLERGTQAVTDVRNRFHERGKALATGDELRALNEAVCLADDIEEQSNRVEIRRDLKKMFHQSARKGGATTTTEVTL